MGTRTPTTLHVFRQRSPVALAVVCGVTGLFLLFSLARSWADDPQPLFVAWILFVLAGVWSVFVRPAVLIDLEGVTIRNVIRDIHIPWSQVTDVEFRWNLKVFAGDRGYTAWAISSQAERPRSGSGGMFSMLPGRLDRFASADAASSMPAQKVTASMVARLIEQARQEYDEAVVQGRLPAAPATEARVRTAWVPLALAVLLLPAVAILALSLT